MKKVLFILMCLCFSNLYGASKLSDVTIATGTFTCMRVSSISFQSDGFTKYISSAVWGGSGSAGDNLGNHIATTTLSMGNYRIDTSSVVKGVVNIIWADGTVQVSSPQAGGSSASESTTSTMTKVISSGGDVFVSSSQYEAVLGAWTEATSSMWITGIEPFVITPSTYGSCNFNIAYATAGVYNSSWTYILDGTNSLLLEVSTASQHGNIVALSNFPIMKRGRLALHCLKKPNGVAMPSGWGVKIRYWYYKNEE